jgi:hypothetical protein
MVAATREAGAAAPVTSAGFPGMQLLDRPEALRPMAIV